MICKDAQYRCCNRDTSECDDRQNHFYLFIYFILFATLITKNIGKEEEEEKKEVARRPNRNYRSL